MKAPVLNAVGEEGLQPYGGSRSHSGTGAVVGHDSAEVVREKKPGWEAFSRRVAPTTKKDRQALTHAYPRVTDYTGLALRSAMCRRYRHDKRGRRSRVGARHL